MNLPQKLLLLVLFALPFTASAGSLTELKNDMLQDYTIFYSPPTLVPLTLAFSVGGLLANSNSDQKIRNWIQTDIRHPTTNRWAANLRFLGTRTFCFTYVGATALWLLPNSIMPNTMLGTWGERSLRAVVVGAPAMALMQWATGAMRPTDGVGASHWQPLQHQHGVSGHSFFGAIPFIVAAQMANNSLAKATLYAGSSLPGLSRLNDDKHYFSQVLLGWVMAYSAVNAVNRPTDNIVVTPLPVAGGAMVAVQYSMG